MMKYVGRLIVVVLFLVASIEAIESKKEDVRSKREKPVQTILSEMMSRGAPVETVQVQRKSYSSKRTVTLLPCGSTYCFRLTRNELRQAHVGAKVLASDNNAVGRIISIGEGDEDGLYEVKVQFERDKMTSSRETKANGRRVAEWEAAHYNNVLVVPSSALIMEEGHYFLALPSDQNKVELRRVQLGEKNGEEAWIKSGIKDGEYVVTEGQSLISRFQKINIVKQEANL